MCQHSQDSSPSAEPGASVEAVGKAEDTTVLSESRVQRGGRLIVQADPSGQMVVEESTGSSGNYPRDFP